LSIGYFHSELAFLSVKHQIKGPSPALVDLTQHDVLTDTLHPVHLGMG
jgi:hypothetical protein